MLPSIWRNNSLFGEDLFDRLGCRLNAIPGEGFEVERPAIWTARRGKTGAGVAVGNGYGEQMPAVPAAVVKVGCYRHGRSPWRMSPSRTAGRLGEGAAGMEPQSLDLFCMAPPAVKACTSRGHGGRCPRVRTDKAWQMPLGSTSGPVRPGQGAG